MREAQLSPENIGKATWRSSIGIRNAPVVMEVFHFFFLQSLRRLLDAVAVAVVEEGV